MNKRCEQDSGGSYHLVTNVRFFLTSEDFAVLTADWVAELITLRVHIFARIYFRESKKFAFREDLFSRIEVFQKFREDLFSRIQSFTNFREIDHIRY